MRKKVKLFFELIKISTKLLKTKIKRILHIGKLQKVHSFKLFNTFLILL